MKTIGILGAMPEEVALLSAALGEAKQETYAGVEYHTGAYAGYNVIVCCAGMGKANAAATTQVLITRYGAEAILFSGIAGNMSPSIGIGDVVVGDTVVYHDAEDRMLAQSAPFTATYTAAPALVAAACAACEGQSVNHIVGRIATGDRFVGDPETKNRIQKAVDPACVEMEGAAVAQIAMRNEVPFVVVRAMSDNSDHAVEDLNDNGFEFEIVAYANTAAKLVLATLENLSKGEGHA